MRLSKPGVLLQGFGSGAAQFIEVEQLLAGAAPVLLAEDGHHVLEWRDIGKYLGDIGEELSALDNQVRDSGVVQDVANRVGPERVVDRNQNGAELCNREVGGDPFRAVVGVDAHLVTGPRSARPAASASTVSESSE